MWLFGLNQPKRPKRQRRGDRFSTELLSTPLGRLKDLSTSGLRIEGTGRTALAAGQVHRVTLESPQGELNFIGRVVWVKRQRKGFQAGFMLLDVQPHIAAYLTQLGQYGFIPEAPTPAEPEQDGLPKRKPVAGDPYAILGIDSTATDAEVQQAYRREVRKHHPDANKSADAAAMFARVVDAYRTIQRRRINMGPNAAAV
jgi:hypothetical protein